MSEQAPPRPIEQRPPTRQDEHRWRRVIGQGRHIGENIDAALARRRERLEREGPNWRPDNLQSNSGLMTPLPSEQNRAGETFPYRHTPETPPAPQPGDISPQDRAALENLRRQLGNSFDFNEVDRHIARQDLRYMSSTILGRDMEPATIDAIAATFGARDAQDYTRLLAERLAASPTHNTVRIQNQEYFISIDGNHQVHLSYDTNQGRVESPTIVPIEHLFGMIQPRLEPTIQHLGAMFATVNTTPNPDSEHYTYVPPTEFPITGEQANRYIPEQQVPFLTAYGANPRAVPFAYENPTAPDGSRRDRRDASYALGEAATNFDSGLFALAKASAGSVNEQATLYRTYGNGILTIHQLKGDELLTSWLQAQGNLNGNPPSSLYRFYTNDRENGQLRDPDNLMLGYDDFGSYSAEATRTLWEERREQLQALFSQAPQTIQLTPHHIRWMEFLAHPVNVDRLARDISTGYTHQETAPEGTPSEIPVQPAPVGEGAFTP